MPNQKEVQWSQLKVGVLIIVALSALMALVFLMSGNTGGLFGGKLTLRSYFENSAGLRVGAPVNLDGVTIGSVTEIHIVSSPRLTPVEVVMNVSKKYQANLHVDSRASLSTVGVLGNTIIDIDNRQAVGNMIGNDAILPTNESPNLQDVIQASQGTIQQLNVILGKVNSMVDQINSGQGTLGKFISDPKLFNHLSQSAANLDRITSAISNGQGTIGKLINSPSMYNKLNHSVNELDQVATRINEGQGTLGKLVVDPELYNNMNQSVSRLNDLLDQINHGQGALGMMVHDQAFARKISDTVNQVDSILRQANQGEGTVGQLLKNPSLYDHANQTAINANQLITMIRKNPKKYLTIHMKLF